MKYFFQHLLTFAIHRMLSTFKKPSWFGPHNFLVEWSVKTATLEEKDVFEKIPALNIQLKKCSPRWKNQEGFISDFEKK
jgi:hypothetical protein